MNMRSLWRCAGLIVTLYVVPNFYAQAASKALDWPASQITWVVGFAPGGTSDILTRIAAHQLSARIGRTVVVENRPGASGAIALKYVAHSAPAAGMLITVPGPIIFSAPEPEIGKELAPVALMAQGPMVIVAGAKNALPALKDVLDDARKNPTHWSFASSGTGTSQHLAGELLNMTAHVHIQHVPYKGGSQALNDVIGGQIPLAILGSAPVLPHIRSGALKAYAVTTRYRIASLKDVPTMQELGFSHYDAAQWFGVATSNKTPAASVTQLNAVLQDIFKSADFQKAVETAGMIAGSGSAQDFLRFYVNDAAKWQVLIKQAGISITN